MINFLAIYVCTLPILTKLEELILTSFSQLIKKKKRKNLNFLYTVSNRWFDVFYQQCEEKYIFIYNCVMLDRLVWLPTSIFFCYVIRTRSIKVLIKKKSNRFVRQHTRLSLCRCVHNIINILVQVFASNARQNVPIYTDFSSSISRP